MADFKHEILGRYKLLALLATGGMAEIFLARQTGIQGFERLVVVKRILPHLAKEKRFLDMFFDEARIAAQLNHPNVVQIYDLGKEGDDYFIAMEYLEGESLGYLVSEAKNCEKPLPFDLAAGIIGQVCDGLGYAHNLHDESGKPLNIVHRDVSPQNVIVLFSGGVKLVDFGIAKAAFQMHQTRVGTLKGKLSYMAPEQCLGKPAEPRSDVFSLGVVFWELLTQQRLFKRDNEAATIRAVMVERIPPVRALRPEVPVELERIAMRAVERKPEGRFDSAGEMGAALREFLRQTGAAAGVQEIAALVERVFADRARTKRRLLDDIRRADGKQITLNVLKPETEESLPSWEEYRGVSDPDSAEVDTQSTSLPTGELPQLPPKKWRRAVAWMTPAILLTAIAVWWGGANGNPKNNLVPGRTLPIPTTIPQAKPAHRLPEIPGRNVINLAKNPGQENNPPKLFVSGKENVQGTLHQAILNIHSAPAGCKVEVDGIGVPGVTPIENLAVAPQIDHKIEILCPKFKKEAKRSTLRSGERVTVNFDLYRRPPPLEPAVLRVDSEPWSEVYIGRRRIGITPILALKMPPGKYLLTLVVKERGLKKTVQVTLKPGKTTTVSERFNK